jgi:iron complex outermembrane receptor protein
VRYLLVAARPVPGVTGRALRSALLLLVLWCLAPAPRAQETAPPAPPADPEDDVVRLEDEVTVTAGHSDRRIQDVPLRVEVVDREEIEEKALMTPGSVAMLLAETTGLRVQTTAPATGAANVRIQGLRGRYSLLLSDGLHLHGVDGGSLSLLQVPPLDLDQVEIIKGAASALYGPSALGGVINLVSRRPRERERQGLLNASTQEAVDATVWLAEPPRGDWSGSVIGGFHGQRRQDLDGDGWSDLPSYARGVLRPRIHWDDGVGHSVFATLGGMTENRRGGTEPGAPAPDGEPFPQYLDTRQADAGIVGRFALPPGLILSLRGSLSDRHEDRIFGVEFERGRRTTTFGEVVLGGAAGRHTWLVGASVQRDSYHNQDLPRFDYTYTTPSLFAQDELRLGSRARLGVSARIDDHSAYGTFASPRVSLLVRPAASWTARLSAGTGFFAPTPFLEETEEAGLGRLEALRGLVPERARSASFDLGWAGRSFDVNVTVFGSRVEDAAQRRQVEAQTFAVVNADLPVRTWGLEFLARYRRGSLLVMVTHSYTSSTEEDPEAPGRRRAVPLTPDHVASLNILWENEERGRIGLEVYYTGRQALDENPYRAQGRDYVLFGLLGEKRFGSVRVFLNLENIGNVRQTHFDPLLRPSRAPDGRWTVDAWAPLDGFVANAGVRVSF